jgi:hypothetical protein
MADGSSPTEQDSVGHRSKVTLGSIARYFSGGSSDRGSNYGTMCERLALMAHRSVRCRLCRETPGVRELAPEEMRNRWQRVHALEEQIARARRDGDGERARKLGDDREALGRELCRETECPACKGTGFTAPTRAHRGRAGDSMFVTVRCSKCWGCGEPVGEVRELQALRGGDRRIYRFASLLPTDATAERHDRCLGCGGESYIVPVTVRETGSSKQGKAPARDLSADAEPGASGDVAPTWLDEDALAERGRVSRALEGLRRADPLVASVVAELNGPAGDKWGAHRWGRVFVVWQFTNAGIVLAREAAERSRRGHGHLLPPLELIATEREAEFRAASPNPRRRSLLSQADAQARALHARALAWVKGIEAA